MTLVHPGTILQQQNFVVAANAILLEQAEALIAAGEKAETGIVLQLSENTINYHGSIEPIALALLALARQSKTPVAVHLDHATSPKLVLKAIEMGFPSVMFDGSQLPFDENLSTTIDLAQKSRNQGVWFEAELGEVGGKDGVHAPGVRTDPSQAADFVEQTKVDALAVAVGSSHAMSEKKAHLDLKLIVELASAVPVPLVLHGSSGVELPELRKAISAGIRKVNVATEFNIVFNNAVAAYFRGHASLSDPRKYLRPAKEAMEAAMVDYLRELNKSG
jgi:fructose-bisphosphate aldolase class II